MSHHRSLSYILLTIFLLQISNLQSFHINSDNVHHTSHEENDYPGTVKTLFHLMKGIFHESDLYRQALLLNRLHKYYNRMCTTEYIGSLRVQECQRIADLIHKFERSDQKNIKVNDNHANNEQHGVRKRFFCNGFVGCKNVGR